jgi:DNA polymerase-3 subunit gamma/tau
MAQLVFYRKYRPQTFKEILEQQIIVQTLSNAILENKIAHAYLFCGPRGTGKTSMARVFAKAINCFNRKDNEYEPCNKCESCNDINNGSSFDVIELDAASNRGIDEIRNLKDNIKIKPLKSKYKIFIIDEAHQLTEAACNALLKVLEEPPEYAIFIFATTNPEKMIPTILSRVQRFDFKRISLNGIIGQLEKICKQENIKYEKEALKMIALSARGGVRDSESILGQVATFDKEVTVQEVVDLIGNVDFYTIKNFIDLIIQNDKEQCIQFIHKLDEEGFNLLEVNKGIIEYLRNLVLLNISKDLETIVAQTVTKEELEILKEQAELLDNNKIYKLILAFLQAQNQFYNSPIDSLPLELVILEQLV